MIADLKSYPVMKDSGMTWLENVPEHWDVLRLRNIGDMRVSNVDKHTKEDELPARLCNYVNVYKNERITNRVRFMVATATSEEIARFRLERDDVLITKDSESWNDIGVPALVEHSAPDLVCGYHLALLRPFCDLMKGGYLLRAMQSPAVAYQFHVEANGVTRYGLSHAAIKSVWLPVPPLAEQSAIVRYLDYMDRRIRKYIRAKQKLIKLLEEQKQAIIHRAVTRGLDPNVRLKPSGVEWLGDVPEHWEVARLSKFFTLQRGFDITKDHQREGQIPVVSSGGISSYHDSATGKGPGVIVGRKGTAGSVHYVDTDYWAHDTTLWVNDFKGNCPRFIYYILIVLDLKRFDTGSANPTLNRNVIHPERLAFPLPDEQARIALWIDAKLVVLNSAIDFAHREISLLREYRTRLIADVVTGKLDVREAAARLPDETDESVLLDEVEETDDNVADASVEEVANVG